MGYSTYFNGNVQIDPPLNKDEISYLKDFALSRRRYRQKGALYIGNTENYETSVEEDVIDNTRPDPDQPGLWCQWTPSDDGTTLEWDQGEKFYQSAAWMKYIVENLLAPSAVDYLIDHGTEDPRLNSFTCGHTVNGTIYAEGEESDDRWQLVVKDNVVMVADGEMTYKEPVAI